MTTGFAVLHPTIIFTGGNHWKLEPASVVRACEPFTTDFKMLTGQRWIKASRRWAKPKSFFCTRHFQLLTETDIERLEQGR